MLVYDKSRSDGFYGAKVSWLSERADTLVALKGFNIRQFLIN